MSELSKKIMYDPGGGGGMFPDVPGTSTEHLTADGKRKPRKKSRKGSVETRKFEQVAGLDVNLTVVPVTKETPKNEPQEKSYWWEKD